MWYIMLGYGTTITWSHKAIIHIWIIWMQKISVESLLSFLCLWSRARLVVNKKRNIFFVARSPACWNIYSWFWILWKNRKRKKQFVTKFVKTKVAINFIQRCVVNSRSNLFFPMLKDNLQDYSEEIFSNHVHFSWRAFKQSWLYFRGFQNFLIYLEKYSWSLLESPNLIFQHFFARKV